MSEEVLIVGVTGASGFIGRWVLKELENRGHQIFVIPRTPSKKDEKAIEKCDVIMHLAACIKGSYEEQWEGNVDLAKRVASWGKPLVMTSTTHVYRPESDHGKVKLIAESVVMEKNPSKSKVVRLPGVFGPGCKPDYNNVVATWMRNAAVGRPLVVADARRPISLVYVEDVASFLVDLAEGEYIGGYYELEPAYRMTLIDLAERIKKFWEERGVFVEVKVERKGTRDELKWDWSPYRYPWIRGLYIANPTPLEEGLRRVKDADYPSL